MLTAPSVASHELQLASRVVGTNLRQSELAVPTVHCGACVQSIERVLGGLPGVERARVNLSTRRVSVTWRGETPPLVEALNDAGFEAHPDDAVAATTDPALSELVRALAVAGFAAGNIMMLSVAVWSGADPATRLHFHWLSAVIALPSLLYCGRVFFRSAWQALRHGRSNMDVPISVGVVLAFAMSLYETLQGGPHAYFDAALSLLFFLLVGRTMDHVMRERTRQAVQGLARLAARGATVRLPGGAQRYMPVEEIQPGAIILLAAGDRVPVDAVVVEGRSALDVSLVTGESLPRAIGVGDRLQAGMLNVGGPLAIRAAAVARDSFLADMTRLMEAAEAGRTAYRRIADRAARLYAPVVHLTALLTCIGWIIATDDLHRAITVAVAVLIITCPCALGLAVPMVQVVAARRLFDRGIMVKDGSALERLAEVDHVIFDKTGTLTHATPVLVDAKTIDIGRLALAAALASQSRHPYSQAIAGAGRNRAVPIVGMTDVREEAGAGLEGRSGGRLYWLGRMEGETGVALMEDGRLLQRFAFQDDLRRDVREAIAALKSRGIGIEIVSGDDAVAVDRVASALGVARSAAVTPSRKADRLTALAEAGHKVLMVGDGLNDVPALATAHVSMAPASAADIGRNAADLVFLRDSLLAVPQAIDIASQARVLVGQNLAFAVIYNVLAVPVAILGLVTPLLAAIAMSTSSIAVVANALRLGKGCKAP